MKKMLFQLNVIDREGKKTAIDIEEGTTIRDAIEEKLSPDNYGVALVYEKVFWNINFKFHVS